MQAAPSIPLANKNTVTVRSILLKDSTGKVQAILPFDAMLDLKSIQDSTGRQLVAVTQN